MSDALPTGNLYTAFYSSPLGALEITTDDHAVRYLFFATTEKRPGTKKIESSALPPVMERCFQQLDQYFQGTRTMFDLPLHFVGTEFQKKIWTALTVIPYGETISYLTLARRIDNEKAVRAVGQTNGANPISIIVPCHRVIGSNGKLTGYGGDLWRKEALLKHEIQYKPTPALLFF